MLHAVMHSNITLDVTVTFHFLNRGPKMFVYMLLPKRDDVESKKESADITAAATHPIVIMEMKLGVQDDGQN